MTKPVLATLERAHLRGDDQLPVGVDARALLRQQLVLHPVWQPITCPQHIQPHIDLRQCTDGHPHLGATAVAWGATEITDEPTQIGWWRHSKSAGGSRCGLYLGVDLVDILPARPTCHASPRKSNDNDNGGGGDGDSDDAAIPASSQPASHSILASQRAGSTQAARCEASPLRA
eukprot:COSAG01_NODE_416_length_17299_cov_62.219186_12_plen_174_part_00